MKYVTKSSLEINTICLILCVFSDLSAQTRKGIIITPSSKNTDQISVIDSCYIRAWYAFNADSINNPNTYIDFHRLEIGDKIAKYYSYFIFNSDSLCTAWINHNPHAETRPRRLGPGGKDPDHWSEYKYSEYFIDYSKNQITEYSRMPFFLRNRNCQTTEIIPIQKWNIFDDTKLLMGNLCQKAKCYFRGREYEAWFAMDIPVSNGPWKFNGLPGLILKINDIDNLYSFECVKIEIFKEKIPIKKYNYENYKKIDRLKLLEFQREIHERYEKVPYHSLELE